MARARRAPFFQADLGVFGGGRLTDERPRKSWPVSTDDQNLAQQRLDAGFTATFSQRSLSPIRGAESWCSLGSRLAAFLRCTGEFIERQIRHNAGAVPVAGIEDDLVVAAEHTLHGFQKPEM